MTGDDAHGGPLTPRIPLLYAALWVLAGGLGAQLVGALVATVATLVRHGGRLGPDAGPQSDVLIPAMIASGLTLAFFMLIPPLASGVPMARAFGFRRASPAVYLAAAVGTFMLGPTADLLMSAAAEVLPGFTMGVVPMLQEAAATMPLWALWPAFALLPGIAEELAFRGILQRSVRSARAAILISGIAFALFHVDPPHVAGVLPLGLYMAWVAQRSGTQVTIVAHVVNNTVALLAARTTALNVGFGTDTEMPLWWVPASLLFTGASVLVIARATKPARPAVG